MALVEDDTDGLHVEIELVVGFENIRDIDLEIIALVPLPLPRIEKLPLSFVILERRYYNSLSI